VEPTTNAIADLTAAVKAAKASDRATLIHINSDPLLYSPSGEGWWDVPIAEVSTMESTQKSRANYEEAVKAQNLYLGRGSADRN
ncbi:MAG: 3D-(3,5/4)-trihydroxycyclohexane-1,2-dione acylhydrolase (decyclizing), partial [Aurantimicrobium sp.]